MSEPFRYHHSPRAHRMFPHPGGKYVKYEDWIAVHRSREDFATAVLGVIEAHVGYAEIEDMNDLPRIVADMRRRLEG